MANAYIGLAKLATHPSFYHKHCTLACHICLKFETTKASEFDKHFLAHDPDEVTAQRWLSGRTFEREKKRGRWVGKPHPSQPVLHDARKRKKVHEFVISEVKVKVWHYVNLGPTGEFAVEILCQGAEPYWLEDNNSWKTKEEALVATLKHLEELT